MTTTRPPRVVVAGALANKAGNGGEAWVRLSWVRALSALGGDVALVERLGAGADRAGGCRWFAEVTTEAGLEGRAWLVGPDDRDAGDAGVLFGDPATLRDHLARCDLLVDVSGNVTGWPAAERVPCRVHVDLDPGYTQVWAETGLVDLSWHHLHATVGRSVGGPDCRFPTGGRRWIGILPPVHLPDWRHDPPPPDGALTTVTSWRGPYGPLSWDGDTFGVKAHAFRALAPLAERSPVPLELALQIDPADGRDVELLRGHGWRITDPVTAAGTPRRFADYVASSLGELSAASPVYVEGRTGWFSDRTVRYLASGRAAIVEDTGWSRALPTGAGLFAFTTADEALAAVEAVRRDPRGHGRSARELAEAHLAPRAALGPLLDAVGWPS